MKYVEFPLVSFFSSLSLWIMTSHGGLVTVNHSDPRDTEHSKQLAGILWHGKKGFEFQHLLSLDERFSCTIARRCFPIVSFLTTLMNFTEFVKTRKKHHSVPTHHEFV